MSTDALLAQFENHLLAAGRGTGTVRLRLGYLRQLARLHPDLLAVQREDLEQFLALRRTTHKAETRASIRTAFRLFYTWAVQSEHLDRDPSVSLGSVRKPATVPRIAVDGDIRRALADADERGRAMVLLARFGCLRRAEIAGLHMRDRSGTVLRVRGKGEKERRVPLNPMLLAALEKLEAIQEHGYYFPGKTGAGIDPDAVFHLIHKLSGWNPHALRHAGATAAYRATRDLRAVQELLGHASIATTERYLHVDEAALTAVAAATATGFDAVA